MLADTIVDAIKIVLKDKENLDGYCKDCPNWNLCEEKMLFCEDYISAALAGDITR